jgi:hypothetical protein
MQYPSKLQRHSLQRNECHFSMNPKMHMEAQMTANCQGKIEQKEKLWRYQNIN